jgi:hypothetical protein
MVIVSVLVAVATSVAMAAPLGLKVIAPLGTLTTSQGTAITEDGLYVVGYDGGGTTDRSFLWTATGGTTGPMLAGSYMSAATGIAYRKNPITSAQELMVGGKMTSGQIGMFRSTNMGATWTRPFATAGSAPGTGASNTVGGNMSSDNAWLAWAEGTTAYSITNVSGDPTVAATSTKSVTQKNQIWGVSNVLGRAAADRKDAGGVYQNLWLGYVTGGGTATQNFFAGLDGTLHGVPGSMSGDGTKVFGQSPKTGDTANNYGYKYDIASNTTTALPELPGTGGSTSRAFLYGASVDGNFAVGMQYVGMERAALWYNLNDPNPANWKVLDLTTWALNNLGTEWGTGQIFTGNMRRAYSVGVNADGQPVITGMGYINAVGTRGFVITVPEPATLAFLALGGLAMLRRRR